MPILNKDMTVCISLAARPSNLGTRFHNYLYDLLGLNFIYKAFTTDDLPGAIRGVRALGLRGCSISMPFKTAVIDLVDDLEPSAAAIDSVNTIVNDGGRLTASNTDLEAVIELIDRHGLSIERPVVVRGSGGMAKAVVAAFRDRGFADLTVYARTIEAGGPLAEKYGYRYSLTEPVRDGAIVVNATPIGMRGPEADQLAFSSAALDAASFVCDVVATPAETPLIRAAIERGLGVLGGIEVQAIQAARQFERYTGRTLSPEQISAAAAFARAEA